MSEKELLDLKTLYFSKVICPYCKEKIKLDKYDCEGCKVSYHMSICRDKFNNGKISEEEMEILRESLK